jgi:hypothetical protein
VKEFVPHTKAGKRLNMSRTRANWAADQALFLLEK